jgi:uncharacterized protein
MKKILLVLSLAALSALTVQAQVLLSGGLTYSQNFDSLANTPEGATPTWGDNTTLVGWYASRSFTAGSTSSFGPYAYTSYRVGNGSANNGWIWGFGTAAATDRALGSLGSGTIKTNAFGVWIKNDTGADVNNILVSYTGEEWRNGGNASVQYLTFSYKTLAADYSGAALDTVAAGFNSWVGVSALNFASPTVGATAASLDGNLSANRTLFSGNLLAGVTVAAGSSIFLRWVDIDDSGNDHGLAVDDFSVSFTAVPEPTTLAIGGCLALLGLVLRHRSRK